jgi:sugar phosphate isomerase/epimerase
MAVETVADFLALRRELGIAELALCLDVGHLYVTGEGEPSQVVPLVKDMIAQVHLEDMRRGVHEHLIPGAGEVDFPAVRRALEAGNYAGPVCFELSRSSHQAPEALGVCRRAWERGQC